MTAEERVSLAYHAAFGKVGGSNAELLALSFHYHLANAMTEHAVEARADERKKLIAMLREPSIEMCNDIRENCYRDGFMSLRPVLQRLADLLKRAP